MAQEFGADRAEIARGLGRRRLLQGAALLGVAPATLARAAGVPEVVLCNWGGDAVPAFTKAWAEPYQKQTGGVMTIDGSGPTNGKIRAMVEANSVRWDVCDSGVTGLAELASRNLLTPIDYTIVDKFKVLPGFAYEFGVCDYMFSTVLAWDTSKIKGTPTLADFFDLKKIPGRRMVRKDNTAMIEMALLADGVPMDKLYPLDVDRAMRKFATIKDSLLVWDTATQSQSLLRDGEAVMGLLWNTRAQLLKSEDGSRIDYNFNGGVLQPSLWVVPKGNPAGKQVMVAIAAMQEPTGQVALLTALSTGPANPAAASMVPAAVLPTDPSAPANAAIQVKISAGWYRDFHGATYRRFLEFLST
jgi:putative spermidine/putrescine transport system substrate-binding protein